MEYSYIKQIISLIFVTLFLFGCAPEIGNEQWCKNMKEKDKGDWR
jgi:hypothetical protein